MRIQKRLRLLAIGAVAAIAFVMEAHYTKCGANPNGVQAAGQSMQTAVPTAWQIFNAFVQQAGSGQPSDDLLASNWQSRCKILGGALCPPFGTLNFSKRLLFHGVSLQRFAQSVRGSSANAAGRSTAKANAPKKADTVDAAALLFDEVLYNPAAAACIQQLVNAPSDGRTCTEGVNSPAGQTPMILRPIWAIIPNGATTGSARIYVPGNDSINPVHPVGGEILQWRPVPLDFNRQVCPPTMQFQAAIPIVCFYRVTVSAENLKFYQTSGGFSPQPAVGDTLLLLGFHLIQVQDKNWVWATFGWQAEPSNTSESYLKYSCGDSSACPNPPGFWVHYYMDTVALPADVNAPIPAVFNPYLDSFTTNNSETNCFVCHSQAAAPVGNNLVTGSNINQSQNEVKNLARDYAGSLKPPSAYKATDSMWSPAEYLNSQMSASKLNRGPQF
jgi:hypothetical protein